MTQFFAALFNWFFQGLFSILAIQLDTVTISGTPYPVTIGGISGALLIVDILVLIIAIALKGGRKS